MAKRASKQRLAKFRRDAERLKRNHLNEEIARKLDVDPANFSSYCSGTKNPGEEFLNKFYMIYGEELNNYEHDTDHKEYSQEIDEPAEIRYITGNDKDDHINTLKVNNAHFRYTNRELTDGIRDIALTNRDLARSVKEVAHNNTILTRTNQQLIVRKSPRRFKKPPSKSEE